MTQKGHKSGCISLPAAGVTKLVLVLVFIVVLTAVGASVHLRGPDVAGIVLATASLAGVAIRQPLLRPRRLAAMR